jgi:putative adenylate-forming enzyme
VNRAAVVAAYLRLVNAPKSRAALEAHQRKRLAKLLPFLIERSAFYRDVRVPELERFPIVDKAVTMAEFDRLNTVGLRRDEAIEHALAAESGRDYSRDLRGLTIGLSSGTSGHRGLFVADERERALFAAAMLAKLLPSSLFALRHDRVALLLRSSSRLYEAVDSPRLQFSYFDLQLEPAIVLARMRALMPTIVVGPPSALSDLAVRWKDEGPSTRPIRTYSAAEVLDPIDEAAIAGAFGRPVHQIYQATEGHLGQTCAHGTIHLNEDLMIFEREWVDRASRRFHPIVTDLHRTTQPIVRYRMNDILVERDTTCACGSPNASIERIEGRSDEAFVLPRRSSDGERVLYPGPLRRALLLAVPDANDYRIVQRARDRVELWVDAPDAASWDRAAGAIRRLAADNDCVVPDVARIDRAARDARAKLRRVVRAETVSRREGSMETGVT